MIWTAAQAEQLHALWRRTDVDGKPMFSREQIAEALELKLGAVIAKLAREYKKGKLERRVHNSTDGGRDRGVGQLQRAKAVTDKSLAIRLAAPPLPIALASMAQNASAPIARARGCQWPMWRHGDRAPQPPLFCGGVVLHAHAYCPEHCRLAFDNWHELSRVASALHHAPGPA